LKAFWLKTERQRKGWTQHDMAQKLGVSQPYLSLLEQGHRPLTKRLLAKVQRYLEVPVTELPVDDPQPNVSAQRVAEALGRLGYPGFAHLRRGARWHPAQVLLAALAQANLETRLAEALPWVVLHYADLNWDWLLERVKVKDVQNRLGFVVTLARKLAERRADRQTMLTLSTVEQRLERARLAREDTLGRESMTGVERRWLQAKRPPEAQHWNLLTDLVPERLPYAL
jgi:transcriptional regulator with XRE-family HTH domain